MWTVLDIDWRRLERGDVQRYQVSGRSRWRRNVLQCLLHRSCALRQLYPLSNKQYLSLFRVSLLPAKIVDFYRATRMHSAYCAMTWCPSFCPSVRPSHAAIVSKHLYIPSDFFHELLNFSSLYSISKPTCTGMLKWFCTLESSVVLSLKENFVCDCLWLTEWSSLLILQAQSRLLFFPTRRRFSSALLTWVSCEHNVTLSIFVSYQ